MQPYERLAAWRHCHRLVVLAYAMTARWPAGERYGLTSQVRRAALSAPSNLVEGTARASPREFRRFLDVAKASLAELSYLLLVARDLGMVSRKEWARVEECRSEAARTLWGLYGAVSKRVSRGDERS